MKLTLRDGLATVLVAAIVIPYVGYLVRGDMPFIQDARGMSATALLFGLAAFLTAGRQLTATTAGKVELGMGIVVLLLGLAAVGFAETAAAEVLLAVFVAGIVLVWAAQMLHHAGLVAQPPTALPHS